MSTLETALREQRDAGRKLLVPYVTGGLEGWVDAVGAMGGAGADAVEVGIPFSDPVMDGPTIQEASERSLAGGTTPASVLADIERLDAGIPVVVMTYYNPVFRFGHERFADRLRAVGVAGAIVPDLPLEEIGPWAAAADDAGVDTVLLAAPTAPAERLPLICERSRGFVYGVALLGVTGEREHLAATTREIAQRLKAVTDRPVLVGVGISTPDQAAQACEVADGVVVGSAVVRRMLDSGGPEEAAEFVAEVRSRMDENR